MFIKTFYGYYWPLPNNHIISSYFGPRKSPTSGASTYHKGLDIPAIENTYFISIMDATVIYTGFNGGSGYCIVCKNEQFQFSYCHVSPNYIVSVGDNIIAGQVIGQVGPKYIYDVIGNPYHDSNGLPTNGATTGCHLHLSLKENSNFINPLTYIENL
jgi:murein DD-endopeptidase MepM/ murein hydrolase activator NlpD